MGAASSEPAYRLARAAAAVGDHRRTGGLRLDRRNAEILLGREDERPRDWRRGGRSRHRPRGRRIRRWAPPRLEARALGTVTDDDQPALGQPAKGVDENVDALVRNEPRHGDVVDARRVGRARVRGSCEARDVDRRIHDLGIAVVAARDARRRCGGNWRRSGRRARWRRDPSGGSVRAHDPRAAAASAPPRPRARRRSRSSSRQNAPACGNSRRAAGPRACAHPSRSRANPRSRHRSREDRSARSTAGAARHA